MGGQVIDFGELRTVPASTEHESAYPISTSDWILQFHTTDEGDFSFPGLAAANTIPSITSSLSTITEDPRISGTDIPIYQVSALFDGGLTIDEVAYEFPSLSRAQIFDAYAYSRINPPAASIKYPKEGFKRLLRNTGLADLERVLQEAKRGRRKFRR